MNSVVIHRYGDTHADGIAELFTAARQREPGIGVTTGAAVRRFAALAYNHGGEDFRVAHAGDQLVAVLMCNLERDTLPDSRTLRHFRIVVHPEYRRRGVATRLLNHMIDLDRDREPPVQVRQSNCAQGWQSGHAFLRRHAFQEVEEQLAMRTREPPIDIDSNRAAQSAPVRALGPEDSQQCARISNMCYRGQLLAMELDAQGFDDSARADDATTLVATHEGRLAGFCIGHRKPAQLGYIESLAVRPELQRQGMARALLAATMTALQHGGCRHFELHVGADNAPALALYRQFGFTRTGSTSTYWKTGVLHTHEH